MALVFFPKCDLKIESFADSMERIAKSWKELPSIEKQKWFKKQEEDKARYAREMQEFNAKNKTAAKEEKKNEVKTIGKKAAGKEGLDNMSNFFINPE